MSVRATSIAAYQEAQRRAPTLRSRIFIAVSRCPKAGLTRREISRRLGLEINTVCGRVNELMNAGALVELPPRRCRITGRTARPVVAKEDV